MNRLEEIDKQIEDLKKEKKKLEEYRYNSKREMGERLERLKKLFEFPHNIRTLTFLEYVEYANDAIDEMDDDTLIQDFYDFLVS